MHILGILRVTLCSEPNIFLYNGLKHYIFHSEVCVCGGGGGVRLITITIGCQRTFHRRARLEAALNQVCVNILQLDTYSTCMYMYEIIGMLSNKSLSFQFFHANHCDTYLWI